MLRVLSHAEIMGQGVSTASQTAWALLGLMAAGEALPPRSGRGR